MSPKKLAEMTAIQKAREAHHKALERLARKKGQGLAIWRRLRRLEARASEITMAVCNGEILWVDADAILDGMAASVEEVLGRKVKGFFVNRDPRGYALKLDSAKDYGLHRDFGGYQILAPEIS